MRKYVMNRVAEARERLAPVLRELGLTLYVADNSEDTAIFFRGLLDSRNGSLSNPRSPVTLRFALPQYVEGREAQWHDADLHVDDWRLKPLGRSGWSHQRWWGTEAVPIEKAGNRMFAWIEGKIRKHGVITPVANQDWIVDSEALADLYWEIGGRLRGLAIVRVPMQFGKLSEEVEALTFQDREGRRVHIVPGGIGTVLIDGQEAGKYYGNTAWAARLVERLKKGSEAAVSGLEPPRR
ncbi:hypothetical protein LJR235_002296 [Pararhizobium sp. LjRoot235]|uniref:hypothetical protein n=1 Tax=Pararhizobium sp. LjRoot235 TaxID=3342291 RepID=UPI003ECD4388